MENEFDEKQRRREQARRDLDELQQLMARMHIPPAAPEEIEEDSERADTAGEEALSVDALIERAARAAAEAGEEELASSDETPIAETENTPETEPTAETENAPETAPVTEPENAPETAPVTEPENAPETVPVTEPENAPETAPVTKTEDAPEEAPEKPPVWEPEPFISGKAPVPEKKTPTKPAGEQPESGREERKRTPSHRKPAEKPAGKKQPRKSGKRAARARRRRRHLMRLGTVIVVLLVVIVLLISAVRGVLKGGGMTPQTDGSAGDSTTTQTEELPASQQESEQYLAIKDDDSLPAYAKEYPGLYADAASTEKQLSDSKVCYLTFDDGPSSTCTPDILDTLKKYQVQATFFVVASEIDGNEELIQRIVNEGHTLCIHANEHNYQKIYASTEAYLEDFAAAYDKIYELTGYRVQGFRFPGGSNGQLKTSGNYDAIVAEMTRRGFEYYDWNAYDHDAENGDYTVEQLTQYAIHEVSISSRNDVILLMHDTYGKESTVQALPDIIEGLQSAGIELLPITNSTRPVHFEVDETTPAEYTEPDTSADETQTDTDTTDSTDSGAAQS